MSKINSYKEYLMRFDRYESYVKNISDPTKRVANTLVVSGDHGIGKTYGAEKFLNKHSKCPFLFLNGLITAVNLYKTMWENNDAVIVIDDANSIIQDKNIVSLLKSASETIPSRQMYWFARNPNCVSVMKYNCKTNSQIAQHMDQLVQVSNNKRLEKAHEAKNTFPDTFYFTGALIILTNRSLHTIANATEGALTNRGNFIEMWLTTEGALDIIKSLALSMTEYNGVKINDKSINETIKFLTSEKAMQYYAITGKRPSIRNLVNIDILHQDGMKLNLDILENNTEYSCEDIFNS